MKYSSRIKAEIKIFSEEGKLRDFVMRSILQKWLMEVSSKEKNMIEKQIWNVGKERRTLSKYGEI